MILARVVGTVACTIKLASLKGSTLLAVQPVDPAGRPRGKSLLALDAAQAGIGDTVLVLEEGNSSRMILGDSTAPVRSMVVGVVDEVALGSQEG
ncbi:MAG: EutN/CcmL family microcompartment protein [Thermoanaerobaculaceae bacterium]|jgi:ethanolamine utilization protein EutN|nr:EutN/CcmL family microcompartment protein [Thermoanaerobaculaceae bacterium]